MATEFSWSPGGDLLYVRLEPSRESMYDRGKTYVVRLMQRGDVPAPFASESELASRTGADVVPHGGLFPGPRPSLYAYVRVTTHRNIYRISLR